MDIRKSLKILGIKPGASQDEVKRIYRQRAKEHHPDAGGDARIFHEVTEAYKVLQKLGTDIGKQVTHKSIFEVVEEG